MIVVTLCGRDSFFPRLSSAFGWRYVAAVVLTYGANWGVGGQLVFNCAELIPLRRDGRQLDALQQHQSKGGGGVS